MWLLSVIVSDPSGARRRACLVVWFAAALMAPAATGCKSHESIVPTDTVVSEQPSVVTLALEAVGAPGNVRLTGSFSATTPAGSIGSHAMKVSYDTTRLVFVSDSATASGDASAIHGAGNVVTITAVAVNGFPGAPIFTLRFRPRTGASGAGSMRLTVTELTGTGFDDKLPANAAARSAVAR